MKGELRLSSNGTQHTVHLDGVDISSSLAALTLRLDPRELPSAALEVVATELSVELADARLYIPEETFELLLRFGWAPPVGDDKQEGGS